MYTYFKTHDLQLNPYVTILLLGDSAKTCLLPLWFKITPCPRVYNARHTIEGTEMICNIWDVPSTADQTNRMFFSDNIDKCIIVYDENEARPFEEYASQRDLFAKDVDTIFLILRSSSEELKIKTQAKARGYHVMIHDRLNLRPLKGFIERMLAIIYDIRKQEFRTNLLHLKEK